MTRKAKQQSAAIDPRVAEVWESRKGNGDNAVTMALCVVGDVFDPGERGLVDTYHYGNDEDRAATDAAFERVCRQTLGAYLASRGYVTQTSG